MPVLYRVITSRNLGGLNDAAFFRVLVRRRLLFVYKIERG